MTFDVLTMGEALLRFTPPHHKLFVQSPLMEWHIGGSELNTAVGLSRLGLEVSWLSRLTDNVMGRLIERQLTAEGVDVQHIIWTDEDRLGTYYMEEGSGIRPSQVTYDRADSAMSKITPAHVDLDALMQTPPRLFHTTSITLGVSPSTAATAKAIVTACQEHKIPISFDFNHREKLWDIASAVEGCASILAAASVIFIPARDAVKAYGTDALDSLQAHFPQATLVITRGKDGADARTPAGQTYTQPIYLTETVCRIGGGDAFAAGFLYAYLQGMDTARCLRYGAAVAALKAIPEK